jgi:uncharacterized damage-inducible protein DinB
MRRAAATAPLDLREPLLAAWETNNRVTVFLVERLPPAVWNADVPGVPRRTIRSIAAHLHNSRRSWIRTLGAPHGLSVPDRVDPRRVTRRELVSALKESGRDMGGLIRFGLEQGGRIPPTPKYVWRNLPLDVPHVLSYFVAHEGHHRGQIVLAARQLGRRLPGTTTSRLWGWSWLGRKSG